MVVADFKIRSKGACGGLKSEPGQHGSHLWRSRSVLERSWNVSEAFLGARRSVLERTWSEEERAQKRGQALLEAFRNASG